MGELLKILLITTILLGSSCAVTPTGTIRNNGFPVEATLHPAIGQFNLEIVLPDGEEFAGTAFLRGREAGFSDDPTGVSPLGGIAYLSNFGCTGVFPGNRGHTMWCSFNPYNGIWGGKGICDISDGRIIDLSW